MGESYVQIFFGNRLFWKSQVDPTDVSRTINGLSLDSWIKFSLGIGLF